MLNYFLNSIFYKASSNTEDAINDQIEVLHGLVRDLQFINPNFLNWYVNNAKDSTPPLDLLFPSEDAFEYLKKQRIKDTFKAFFLWNGKVDNNSYASIALSIVNISLSLNKNIPQEDLVKVFEIVLKYLKCKYLYLANNFFMNSRVFEHRQPLSSISYVSKSIEFDEIPHLYQKIDINNELNQGTILIFSQDVYEESENMKLVLQESSVALVDLDLIPEIELDPDFFSEVNF